MSDNYTQTKGVDTNFIETWAAYVEVRSVKGPSALSTSLPTNTPPPTEAPISPTGQPVAAPTTAKPSRRTHRPDRFRPSRKPRRPRQLTADVSPSPIPILRFHHESTRFYHIPWSECRLPLLTYVLWVQQHTRWKLLPLTSLNKENKERKVVQLNSIQLDPYLRRHNHSLILTQSLLHVTTSIASHRIAVHRPVSGVRRHIEINHGHILSSRPITFMEEHANYDTYGNTDPSRTW